MDETFDEPMGRFAAEGVGATDSLLDGFACHFWRKVKGGSMHGWFPSLACIIICFTHYIFDRKIKIGVVLAKDVFVSNSPMSLIG